MIEKFECIFTTILKNNLMVLDVFLKVWIKIFFSQLTIRNYDELF